jgi:hypothetical protein
MKLSAITKPISTVITVFVTLVLLLFGVVMLQVMATELITTYFPEEPVEEKPFVPDLTEEEELTYRKQEMEVSYLPDGTVHLIDDSCDEDTEIEDYDFNMPMGPDKIRVFNIDMEEIWTGMEDETPYRYIDYSEYLRQDRDSSQRWLERDEQVVVLEFGEAFIVPVVGAEGKVLSRWVYSLKDKCFTGYDGEGKVIGYFGLEGFSESKSEVVEFDNFGFITSTVRFGRVRTAVMTWRSPKKIYEIDLGKRTIENLIESKDEDIKFVIDSRGIKRNADFNSRSKSKKELESYRPAIGVVMESGMCSMLLLEPEERVSFQIPKEWVNKRRTGVSIAVYEDEIYLQHSGSDRPSWDPETKTMDGFDEYIAMINKMSFHKWEEIYKVSASGQLESLCRFEWDTLPRIKTNGPQNYNYYYSEMILESLSLASPVVYMWLGGVAEKLYLGTGRRYGNWQVFYEILVGTQYVRPIYFGMTVLVSVLLCGVVLWHGMFRRRGWSGLVFWMAFVVVFNVAGLLTYLALNHVPVIRCHKCRNKKHLKAMNCPSCGAGLPEPESRATDLIKR